MLTRRSLLLAAPAVLLTRTASAQDIEIIDAPELSDYPRLPKTDPFTEDARRTGLNAIMGTQRPSPENYGEFVVTALQAPTGPTPIDIADWFIGYAAEKPHLISQWPKRNAWNPLVVHFFSATTYDVENDLVPWCSAFANWCLRRADFPTTNSAASQSFLSHKNFKRVNDPKRGDVVIFSCYKLDTNINIGLGHVGFLASKPSGDHVQVTGGNQSKGGTSMICTLPYATKTRRVNRTVKGKRTLVDFKLNGFFRPIV